MTAPLLRPTSTLVAIGWLRLAAPGVDVGTDLPAEADAALREVGFIRIVGAGGFPDPNVPMRQPVIGAEFWTAPPLTGRNSSRARAEQLANRVLNATYDPALMGQELDLSAVSGGGKYAPARVHTVTALTEPAEGNEPSDWAKYELDLLILWTEGA